MNSPIITTIDGKDVNIFKSEKENAPIIYANMFLEVGSYLMDNCAMLNCLPFSLVSISKIAWDQDLSPWPHSWIIEPNDDFTGQANQYCKWLLDKIIPYAEKEIGNPSNRIIAGYSMGGLFALYAPYLTETFDAVMSASGSVWYPDFVSFVEKHEYPKNPKAIYLSLGNKESETDNKVVNTVGKHTEELFQLFKKRNINTIYQVNQGNHYQDPVNRMAKGIKWILEQV